MRGRIPWMALIAILIFSTSLAVASLTSEMIGELDGIAAKSVPAAVTIALAVPLLLLCARWERRPMRELGLTGIRQSLRGFALGVLVVGGSAALVFGAATGGGWLRWEQIDWPTFALFLLSNTLIAFCLEALPEELAFRGYVYRVLRERSRAWLSFAGTVLLFVFGPWLSSLIAAGLGRLFKIAAPPVSFAPGGDPFSYAIMLTLFGVVFLIARIATGSLWCAIAAHLTALTVQRATLAGDGFDTGVTVQQTTPDAILLIPAYLLLAGGGFGLARKVLPATAPPRPDAPPRRPTSPEPFPAGRPGAENVPPR